MADARLVDPPLRRGWPLLAALPVVLLNVAPSPFEFTLVSSPPAVLAKVMYFVFNLINLIFHPKSGKHKGAIGDVGHTGGHLY